MRDEKRPMIFSRQPAFQQLQEEGFVYTVRSEMKIPGPVWIRKTRTGIKEFDAKVVESKSIELSELEDYVHGSGFSSVEEWRDAIYQKEYVNLYIHLVEKV